MKLNLYVEYGGKKVSAKEMEYKFKELWKEKGGLVKDLKDIDLYYKPEDAAFYYVVNQSGESGKIEL